MQQGRLADVTAVRNDVQYRNTCMCPHEWPQRGAAVIADLASPAKQAMCRWRGITCHAIDVQTGCARTAQSLHAANGICCNRTFSYTGLAQHRFQRPCPRVSQQLRMTQLQFLTSTLLFAFVFQRSSTFACESTYLWQRALECTHARVASFEWYCTSGTQPISSRNVTDRTCRSHT
jgi:hypothetical protein